MNSCAVMMCCAPVRSGDDIPVQVIASTLVLELPQTDLSPLPQAQRALQAKELTKQDAQIPFYLVAGPPWRAHSSH